MIFTTEKDAPLTKELIEEAIQWNEDSRTFYDELEDYYLGKHEVLTRSKPLTAKNSRVVINHAKYITDTNVGYMLGKPVDYSSNNHDLDPVKEQYREQNISSIDREIAKKTSEFGRQYELVYNDNNKVRSKDIDVRNCVIIYDDTVQHNEMYAILYEKGYERKIINKQIQRQHTQEAYKSITVYDNIGYKNCLKNGVVYIPEEYDAEHAFGLVPVIEYRNNSEYQGDYVGVISLINAYNLLQSDRVNDKEQLVDAILTLTGIEGFTPEQKDLLRQERVMSLPEGATAEYLLKNLDEVKVDVLRQTLKEDIHKISMTPDLTDEKFASNSSGVALRFKLLHFEWNVGNKIMEFRKGLQKRFTLYNNYLISLNQSSEIPAHDVEITFTKNLPQNDYEVSQMINNLRGMVKDATLLEQLSYIEDAESEVEAKQQEDIEKFNMESPQYGTQEAGLGVFEDQVENEVEEKSRTLLDKLSDIMK